jgi:hypothetical protein
VLALSHPVDPAVNPTYFPLLTHVLNLDTTTCYLLVVPGSAHLTFTDAPLFLPPVPSCAVPRSGPRRQTVRRRRATTPGFSRMRGVPERDPLTVRPGPPGSGPGSGRRRRPGRGCGG